MSKKGMFIVFEGIDGAGTSTQLWELGRYIDNLDKYQDVLKTHEPTRNAANIRKRLEEDKDAFCDGLEMARGYVEDRLGHCEKLIKPKISEGVFVISDRFALSTLAYQKTQGVELNELIDMHGDERFITPDLTVFIDTPYKIAFERRKRSGIRREKFEELEFQRRLESNYHFLFRELHGITWLTGSIVEVNGVGSIEEVAKRVGSAFEPYYRKCRSPLIIEERKK